MPVLALTHEAWVASIFHFVKEYSKAERFKEKYGVDIDDWDHPISDEEAINELLNEEPENRIVIFDEKSDGFDIYLVDTG